MSRPSLCSVPTLLPSPSTAPCPAPTNFTNTFDSYSTEIIKVNGPASQILIFKSLYLPLCFTSWSCLIWDREKWLSPQAMNLNSFLTCSQAGAQLLIFSTMDILGQLTPLWGPFCAFWMLTNVHPLEASSLSPTFYHIVTTKNIPRLGQCPLVGKSSHRRITTLEVKEKSYHFFTFGRSLMFILYKFDLYHIPWVRLFMGGLRTPESTELNTNSSPYLWASSISSLISWEKWIICSLMRIYSSILWILDWWFYLQVKLDTCKTVKVIFLPNSLFLSMVFIFHSTTHCGYTGFDTFSWFPS